jgi:low temperature requirement protein LtrA
MTAETAPARRRDWYRPMRPRSRDEEHRVSTPLELFFDLCFVTGIALAAAALHHAVSEGHWSHGLTGYAMSFFAVWWAWVNFTWFASAYDVDDVPYRLVTFLQISGALIVAAGVPRAFDGDAGVVTAGYVLMRLALAAQWLRAAHGDPGNARVGHRYAFGITLCQVAWVLRLAAPDGWQPALFVVVALAELSVPIWAERVAETPWHPEHIAERYGLFLMIVLGEGVLAATTAVQVGVDEGDALGAILTIAASGAVVTFAMWWLYFALPAERLLTSNRESFVWGYGHYVIFASAAAVGAGLAVAVDGVTHHTELGGAGTAAAVTVPVAVFLLSTWFLHVRPHGRGLVDDAGFPAAAALVLLATLTPVALPLTALVLVGLVTACTIGPDPVTAEPVGRDLS